MKQSWLTLALLVSLAGCGDDPRIRFEQLNAPAGDNSADASGVHLEHGIALAAVAAPVDDEGELCDLDTEVELTSSDAGVLEVQRIELDPAAQQARTEEERRGDWSFLFSARATGRTELELRIDGDAAGTIAVEVVAQ